MTPVTTPSTPVTTPVTPVTTPSPPVTTPVTPSTAPQLANPLNFRPDEDFVTFAFNNYNVFDRATQSALVQSQISGVASFNGEMFARLGTESEFLYGQVLLDVGFQSGTVTGFVRNLRFDGSDAVDRNYISPFESLAISRGTVNGSDLSARISGDFTEGSSLGFFSPDIEHSVSGNMNLVFVDPVIGDFETAFVGTMSGTITSIDDGTRPLVGIVSGDKF